MESRIIIPTCFFPTVARLSARKCFFTFDLKDLAMANQNNLQEKFCKQGMA